MRDPNFQRRIEEKLSCHQQRVMDALHDPSTNVRGNEVIRQTGNCLRVLELLRADPKEWQEEWIELQRLLREIDEWREPGETAGSYRRVLFPVLRWAAEDRSR